MNSNYLFSSPNPVDYSSPNPVDYSSPNPVDYSYLAHTNSEEHHPWSSSNTKLPIFNLGVGNSMSNTGQAGGSNSGHLSGPKPRGRPRGAKNKPKENVVKVTSPVRSAVLEIPPGNDVVEWVKQFAQTNNIFVNVLSAYGMISQVAYSHMLAQHPIILSEALTLISCTGIAGLITPSGTGCYCFTAALARLNGTVVGGMLWKLVTMEPVLLTVLISKNPEVVGAGY